MYNSSYNENSAKISHAFKKAYTCFIYKSGKSWHVKGGLLPTIGRFQLPVLFCKGNNDGSFFQHVAWKLVDMVNLMSK